MSKPDKGHDNVHLTFSREHPDHDGGDGTHVDGYRYQAGSDKRDYEKNHNPVTPGYGEEAREIPVRHSRD
jgi:hypothetical protein